MVATTELKQWLPHLASYKDVHKVPFSPQALLAFFAHASSSVFQFFSLSASQKRFRLVASLQIDKNWVQEVIVSICS